MRLLVSYTALKAASFRASEEARATSKLARMRVNIGYAPATVSPAPRRALG